MMRLFATLGIALTLGACTSTKIKLDDRWNSRAKPSYEDYFNYYFFGLKGTAKVDIQGVCMDQMAYGIQYTRSLDDGILAIFTLGIYTPKTVRIWCGDK